MPRRDRHEDDDRPRRKSNTALIVGLSVGGGLLLLAILATAAVMFVRGMNATPSARVYDREDFKRAIMGKTPEEVIATIGKPATTTDEKTPPVRWTYYSRSRDPLTGKTDPFANVEFVEGRVVSVWF